MSAFVGVGTSRWPSRWKGRAHLTCPPERFEALALNLFRRDWPEPEASRRFLRLMAGIKARRTWKPAPDRFREPQRVGEVSERPARPRGRPVAPRSGSGWLWPGLEEGIGAGRARGRGLAASA